MQPLAQPPRKEDSRFDDWVFRLWKRIATAAGLDWTIVDKTGSNLTDIETRHHKDLQYIPADPVIRFDSEPEQQIFIPPKNTYDFDHVTFPGKYSIGALSHIYTLQELMNHEWSAGVVDGCDLTDNGNGTVSTSSGIAVIRAVADGHTTLYGVAVSAQANISLTDDSTNYVYLDYTSGSPQFAVSTSVTSFNCMDKCIAWVIHRSGNSLHSIDAREQNVDANRKMRQLFLKFSRFIHASDGTVLGSSGLAITVSAGSFFFMLQEISHIAFDTSVAGTANANVFTLWTVASGVWTETVNSKTIDTTTYNDTTTGIVTLGNNKFGVTWFYIINDSPSELHAVMGQAEYANIADARVASPPTVVPSIVSGIGSLIGFVVYEKSNTVFDNVYSAFSTAFTPGLATTHNGLSGIQTMSALPNDNYHFAYSQAVDLTDGGDSNLHYHATDRARANHTGTQSADTLTDGLTNKVYTATEQTRLANTSGTNTGDQNLSGYELLSNKATNFTTVNDSLYPSVQAVKTYADGLVVGLLDDRGSYDASVNTFPASGGSGTAGAVLKGDLWYISVAGTLGGVAVAIGDSVRAMVDTPGQTATNWSVLESNIGYVPENTTNKSTSVATDQASDIKFPSVKAVYDWAVALFAPKASPTFTGIPAAPTAAAGTNTTQLATTAHVFAERTNTATLTNKTLTGGLVTATLADNTATLGIADAKFVKSQIAADANSRGHAQSVEMTYAASGSTGIVVADNANIDFGTGNFTLIWDGALPDWTPASVVQLITKNNGNVAGYKLLINTDGLPFVALYRGANTFYYATVSPNLVNETSHHIVASITRETASVAGSISFFVDGVQIGTAVAIPTTDTGAGNSLDSSIPLYVNGTSALREAGTIKAAYTLNRAITAAEALSIYRNGLAYADKFGSQTGQTSGTLTIYRRYRITTFVAGDSFTNVGAASNATGVEFVATGTTPTTWTNGSTLNAIGATLALEPEGIQPNQWHDSANNLHASYPAAGASLARWKETGLYEWTTAITADTTLTSIVPAGYELEKIVFKNSTTNAVSVRLGTTAGGTDIFGLTALNISTTLGGYKTVLCNQGFSTTTAQTLYLSSTAWSSASLTFTMYLRRLS